MLNFSIRFVQRKQVSRGTQRKAKQVKIDKSIGILCSILLSQPTKPEESE